MKYKRGYYNEIQLGSLNKATLKQVNHLVREASQADKIDEHGKGWEFGAVFDRKGRGEALNWSLYAIGRDYYSKRTLIVIQVRQWQKRYKNGYADVKKSHFLIGRNEDNTTFAHPVSGRWITHALKVGDDVIQAVQGKIFESDYTKIVRQGDIGLIPVSKLQLGRSELTASNFTVQDSHLIQATESRVIGQNVYVKNPSIYHLPKTHPNFENLQGWFRVVVGNRANFYHFAPPTID